MCFFIKNLYFIKKGFYFYFLFFNRFILFFWNSNLRCGTPSELWLGLGFGLEFGLGFGKFCSPIRFGVRVRIGRPIRRIIHLHVFQICHNDGGRHRWILKQSHTQLGNLGLRRHAKNGRWNNMNGFISFDITNGGNGNGNGEKSGWKHWKNFELVLKTNNINLK